MKPWITDDILTLCDKRSLKSTKQQIIKHTVEYKLVYNLIRRNMEERNE